MPIHLPPLSRRQFLAGAMAAGTKLLAPRQAFCAQDAEADRWALLADTHIARDPQTIHRGVNMAENLRRVVQEVLGRPRPAGVILDGDCALLDGQAGDYATLAELLPPLRGSNIPIHMTLGNHDDRDHFRAGFARILPRAPLLESWHVGVIETPRANWFLLDSQDGVNKTPGKIGPTQRRWLADALDARPGTPALIVGHHNPALGNLEQNNALVDTQELFQVLVPRKQVKALIFGHTHVWNLAEYQGIHLVNLPPVAYLFKAGLPNGWVDVTIRDNGATLELRALDPKHPAHGKVTELRWRAS
jgi:3',5'-cyclic-AMP phosphodiesterase